MFQLLRDPKCGAPGPTPRQKYQSREYLSLNTKRALTCETTTGQLEVYGTLDIGSAYTRTITGTNSTFSEEVDTVVFDAVNGIFAKAPKVTVKANSFIVNSDNTDGTDPTVYTIPSYTGIAFVKERATPSTQPIVISVSGFASDAITVHYTPASAPEAATLSPGDVIFVYNTPSSANKGLYVVKSVDTDARTITIESNASVAPAFLEDRKFFSTTFPQPNLTFDALTPTVQDDGFGYILHVKVEAVVESHTESDYAKYIAGSNVFNMKVANLIATGAPSGLHIDPVDNDVSIVESPANTFTFDAAEASSLDVYNPNTRNIILSNEADYGLQYGQCQNTIVLKAENDITGPNPELDTNGSVMIGNSAGAAEQLTTFSIYTAVGYRAAHQPGEYQYAFGAYAAETSARNGAFIGAFSGSNGAGDTCCLVGTSTGLLFPGEGVTAVGYEAAGYVGKEMSTAVGNAAGKNNNGVYSISIGSFAGENNQNDYSIAIGHYCANNNQSPDSVAIGSDCIAPLEAGLLAFGNNMEPIQPSATSGAAATLPPGVAGYIELLWNNTKYVVPVFPNA